MLKNEKEQHRINLELKLKNIESNLNSEENRTLFNRCNNDLETTYGYIADGIKTRSNMNGMSMRRNLQSSF